MTLLLAFRLLAAVAMLASAYLAWVVLVRRHVTPLPSLAPPLAVACLVLFEAALMNALSLLRAVTAPSVLAAHVAFVVLVFRVCPGAFRDSVIALLQVAALKGSPRLVRLGVGAMGLLALISVLRYAPNNFDSMTYRLARVAHWIQHRSVEDYPTNILRQRILGPGYDYILLGLQVVSGSDRAASLVQLAAWLVLIATAASLARRAGSPLVARRLAPLAVAAAPMAVLQASSVQSDLVASVLAVAIVSACLPFLHRGHGPGRLASNVAMLFGAGAAAALTKPTALFAAAPFVVMAALASVVRVRRGRDAIRPYVRPALLALALTLALVIPEAIRRNPARIAPELVAEFSYPILGELGSRLENAVRGLFHHFPTPASLSVSATRSFPNAPPVHGSWDWAALRAHEDLAGSPMQVLIAFLAVAVGVVRWPRVPLRARWCLVGSVVAWLLFHAAFRDNPWLARLQLPFAGLLPLSFGSFAALPRVSELVRTRRAEWAGLVLSLALVAHGGYAAWNNELRPPFGERLPYELSYYNSSDTQQQPQQAAIDLTRSAGCRRLGLFVTELSYDYPLTWRAMGDGIEVRHVLGVDAWPCVVYSDRGPPPGGGMVQWRPLAALTSPSGDETPFLFARVGDARR